MSTERSSEPATRRRVSAARPTGAAAGPRRRPASAIRAPSAAAIGTSRLTSVAVSAERAAIGRIARSTRSGSTQADQTAKTTRATTIRSASTAPSASASRLTSICPRTGRSKPRIRIVSPRWEAMTLTATTMTARPNDQRSGWAMLRPAPERIPAPAAAAPAATRTSGFAKVKAITANGARKAAAIHGRARPSGPGRGA